MEYKEFKIGDVTIRYPIAPLPTAEHHAALEQAFNAVSNANDWKAPIDCWIEPEQFDIVAEAIEFYTATEAKIIEGTTESAMIRVVADGYRHGPAGP